jgi:hypothetical protein
LTTVASHTATGGTGRPAAWHSSRSICTSRAADFGVTRLMTIRSAYLAATLTAPAPNAAMVSGVPGALVRSRKPRVLITSPRTSALPPASSVRTAIADSASTVAVRSERRPCHCSTTTGLDEPSATFTLRPVSSASDPIPIAIITGSRTATASGPTVSSARAVRSATTAPSANASNVAISPIQISPYPSSSATCAVRSTSPGARSCHNPSDTDNRGPPRAALGTAVAPRTTVGTASPLVGLLLTASFYHSVSLYCHGHERYARRPASLLDKQEIAELLTRYLRSVDRGDVDTLRSCYLPGATEDR